MNSTVERIKAREYVLHVDDERGLGHGVIVTLDAGWEFTLDPGCGVRGFDTLAEALQGTTKANVRRMRS